MKRALIVILLLAMTISVIGCNSDNKNKGAKKDVPTLVWYVPGDKQADISLVVEEANKIIEPAIGAKIDIQFVDNGAYKERMTMNMASKANFDLLFVGYLYQYLDVVNQGGLLGIKELMQKEAPKLKELIPEYVWKCATVKDEIYAVPNLQIMAYTDAIGIRKDLADKYNFDISKVKSIDDIEPFLQKIKENEPDLFPFAGLNSGLWTPKDKGYDSFYGNTVLWDESAKKIIPYYERDFALQSMKNLHEWYKKGYIRQDSATVVDDTGDRLSGRYASYILTYKPGVEAEEKAMRGYEMKAIPMRTPFLGGTKPLATTIAISKTTKNPEKAIKFIELVNSNKELYNLISFGVEGKHYKKTTGNHIELIKDSKYAPNAAWKFGNQFNAYLLPGQADDVWQQTEKMNNEATKSSISGLFFDAEEIRTEIAQCTKVQQQYVSSIFDKGADDPTKHWDTYVKALQEAGIQKIVNTMQKQVDEFLKK